MGERLMRIVAIMSGKGRVGKTTTCLGTALALQELGFQPAILDLDLENPSMAGRDGATGLVREDLSFPGEQIQAPRWFGIPVMSVSLLPLADFADTPTMIDEEAKHFLIGQLFKEVDWAGSDLLIVDLPPGSGEEVRGLLQLALDGAVIVTSPQRISEAAVRKVMVMAAEYRIPLFGIVENTLYGIEGEAGSRLAQQFQVPLLARLEWSQEILQAMEDHIPIPHMSFLPVAQALASRLLMLEPETQYPLEVLSEPEPLGEGGHPTDIAEPWTAFRDLSDDQWAVLRELLPPHHQTGRTRVDDRALLNGILWVYTTRQPWSAMPQRYGKWATAKKRVERWKQGGFWANVLSQAREFGYAKMEGDFEQPDHDAAVLRDGDQAGQQARPGAQGAAEVPGGQPAQRSDHPAAAPTGDSWRCSRLAQALRRGTAEARGGGGRGLLRLP
jgi:Mrp family chromosome partitioning ATPase/transposase